MADGRTDDIGRTFKLKCVNPAGVALNIPTMAAVIASKEIVIEKPSGDLLTKTATYTSDGSDGILECTVIAADFDERGLYKSEARVTDTSPTIQFASSQYLFTIADPLKPWS